MVSNMKRLVKGSKAAKDFMAKIRAKKGTTKKVGAYKKPKKLTITKKIGSNLNSVKVIFENPKYNYTTDVSSSTTEASAKKYFVGKFFNVGIYPKENLQKCIGIKFNNGKIVSGWKKGNTIFIEKGEKPVSNKKNIIVQRRVVNKPKGSFFDFKNINGMNTNQIDLKNKKTDTYDIVFNDDTGSNNKGFSQTLKYCKDYIKAYNGTGFSYFGDYIGGVVQIINNRTGLVVYETQVKIIKKNRI